MMCLIYFAFRIIVGKEMISALNIISNYTEIPQCLTATALTGISAKLVIDTRKEKHLLQKNLIKQAMA